jgi:hypothetical protein
MEHCLYMLCLQRNNFCTYPYHIQYNTNKSRRYATCWGLLEDMSLGLHEPVADSLGLVSPYYLSCFQIVFRQQRIINPRSGIDVYLSGVLDIVEATSV